MTGKVNKIKNFLLYLVMFVVVAFSVVIIIQFTDLENLFKPDLSKLGLNGIGDFLSGYLGVFISLMTLLLVFFTYNSQKTELKEQREGYELTRAYDLVYKEVEFINNQIMKYETLRKNSLKELTIEYETFSKDIKRVRAGENIDLNSQFNTYKIREFTLFQSLYRGFKTLDFIISQPTTENQINEYIKNKIHASILDFIDTNKNYIIEFETIKSKLKKYDDSEIEEIKTNMDFIIKFIKNLLNH